MNFQKQKKALYISAAIVAVTPFLGVPYELKAVVLVAVAAFLAYTSYSLPGDGTADTSRQSFEEHKPDVPHEF